MSIFDRFFRPVPMPVPQPQPGQDPNHPVFGQRARREETTEELPVVINLPENSDLSPLFEAGLLEDPWAEETFGALSVDQQRVLAGMPEDEALVILEAWGALEG